MADNQSDDKANKDDKPKRRKKVQVVEETVEEPETPEEEDDSLESRTGFKTEKQAGSKVRVARALPTDFDEDPAEPKKAAEEKGEPEEAEKSKAAEQAEQPAADPIEKPQPTPEAKPKKSADTEPMEIQQNVTTQDFEALLAGEAQTAEPQTKSFGAGDQITGEIVAIGEQYIFVAIGSSKAEGMAHRADYETEEGEVEVEVGEEKEFYVLSTGGGDIVLGKKLGGRDGALQAVQTAKDTGVPIEGHVKETNKGGFTVQIGNVEAFCPISQIELGYTDEPSVHVGNTYRFRVKELKDGGRTVVVSRADLLREERKKRAKETMEKLEEGAVLDGTVTRVTDFGAFVDIGGVEGLVHVTELAHSYLDSPSDAVSTGDNVKVKVLNVEHEEGRDEPKIGLSIKETQKNPWETVNEKFSVGQEVEGEIVRLAPFGAFVEIAPGLDGLVHVSEMSWKEHVKHPRDVVSVGDKIRVEVQDIDQVRERISLSMKAVEGDPWDTAEDRYNVGQEVTGTVENVEDFGAFVRLDSGITALVPRSEMELPSGVTPHRRYEEGAEVTARVLNVDSGERKMALTEKAAADIDQSEQRSKPKKSKKKSSGGSKSFEDSGGGFGTLGDLLGDKLDE
ncbi:MAG: S1 RNA-binding domain-containing protein [Myxococcota bacterium]